MNTSDVNFFNFSKWKMTPRLAFGIAFVLLSGDISDGRDKEAKARMSRQPLILNKANLRQKTWLGKPTAFTVGMFVWGNNTMKILWSDSWRDKCLLKRVSHKKHLELRRTSFHLWDYLLPLAENKWKLMHASRDLNNTNPERWPKEWQSSYVACGDKRLKEGLFLRGYIPSSWAPRRREGEKETESAYKWIVAQ